MPGSRVATSVRRSLLAAALLNGAAALAPVYGQAPAAGELLDEVLVRSEKSRDGYVATDSSAALGLPAAVLDTPLSIQSLDAKLLDDQQVRTLWDGLKNVSGVASRGTNSGVNEDFTIRGFQLDPRRNYYRDGARFYNQFSIDARNLERIEVLKGPASILYGALEPGGIINLVAPKFTDTPTRRVHAEYGSYDYKEIDATLSGPLVDDKLFYRVYGSAVDSDSYRNFVEQDRKYINPSVLWNLSEATTLRLSFELLRDEHTADAGIVAILDRPADVPSDTFYGEPGYKEETIRNWTASARLSHQWTPNLRQNASVTFYDTDWERQQVSVEATRGGIVGLPGGPGFPGNPNTLLPRSVYDNTLGFRELSTTHDLVWTRDEGPLPQKVLFGVSVSKYRDTEISGDRVFPTPPGANAARIDIYNPSRYYGLVIPAAFALFRDQVREETTVGAYLQDMITLGDRWIALAGVRFDRTEFDQNTLQGGTRRLLERADSSFSPRGGLVFKATEQLSFYSSFTRSFSPKSGTRILNEPPVGQPVTLDNTATVDPERAVQLEAGAKWIVDDGRLAATLAVYQLTRENLIEANPRFTNYSVQIGEQRSRGVDFDLSTRLSESWSLIASYGYLDAIIRTDADRPAWQGNRLDNAPQHSGSLWAQYTHASGFGAGAGLFHTGKREGNLDNDFRLGSYTRADATLSWRREGLKLALTVRNLTDETYYLNSWRRDRIMPGSPRTAMLSVDYAF